MVGPVTDALGWVVVGAFAASVLLERRSERTARRVAALAWGLFAVFWLLLVPHFAFVQKSYVEGIGTAIAAPASAYTGYLVVTHRPSLLGLSKAVAVMGLLYLPFVTIQPLEQFTVEMTTYHGQVLIEAMGYRPEIAIGEDGYRSVYAMTDADGVVRKTPVLLACSGIGSVAVVTGLVLAIDAPLGRRALAVAVVAPLIYALNIIRVAFIAVAYGRQWFRGPLLNDPVLVLFGAEEAHMVPYFIADRVIAQGLSVVVLVAITLGLLRILPELTDLLEEAVYVVTGRELDLRQVA